jgi:methyl-accepting chemotaxis protein
MTGSGRTDTIGVMGEQWTSRNRLTLSRRFVVLITAATLSFCIPAVWIQQRSLYREKQAATRHAVEVAVGVLEYYGQLAQSGQLSEEAAQSAAAAAVKGLRYEKTDYFWINDFHPRVVMHPVNAALVGQDVSTYADPNGKLIFVEAVKIARQDGGGDMEYMWPKPGETALKVKLSYVKLFPRWNWVVGSGIYIEDIRQQIWSLVAAFIAMALLVMALAMWLASSAIRTVRRTTTSLADGAQQVVLAAREVSGAAQSLSHGATEQAAALEETSAAMEQLATMTLQNAERSRQSADLVRNVDRSVTDSNGALSSMAASMNAIRDSSARVSKIIKTIDEIAFQTNILALNAAVEAARAGEAGMGFAVVAGEVRNLAQRAAVAARDTTALIEEAAGNATDGAAKLDRMSGTIGQITKSVAGLKTLVEEVSEATRQQATGIDQVRQSVVQMETVTQTTAGTAEESAAASEELNSLAATATRMVAELETLIGGADRPAVNANLAARPGTAAAAVRLRDVRVMPGHTEPEHARR